MDIAVPSHPAQAEDRLRLTRTLIYFATFVTLGLAGVTLGPTLQGLADHTRSRLSEISIVFVARSCGYMTGSFVAGRLYDRVAGHPLIGSALAATSAMLFLTPIVPLLWLLAVVIFILGAVEGAVDVGGNTLLVWVHGPRVGPFMNALHFCWGLGAFLSPIVVAQAVLISGDITLAYWFIGLVLLPVAVALLRLPSPAGRRGSSDQPSAPVNRGLAALIVAFFFLFVGVEVTFGGWIFTYAVALGQMDGTRAAYLTSTFWGALTLGRFLGIPLAARIAPRTILLVDLLGCIASVVLILLLPRATWALWLGTFGAGLFMASMFPTTISFAERRLTITGQMTGWFLVGSAAGGMSIPWLIGQLFDVIGPRITMIMALLALLSALVVLAALLVRRSD